MTKEPVPREKHKARMIEIAASILEKEGLNALQARRIAQDCGCSVGTLYNTFDGLDDLIVQANGLTLDRLHAVMKQAESDGSDAADRLLRLALAYKNFALENELLWRAVFEHRPTDQWKPPTWYTDKQSELFGLVEQAISGQVAESSLRQRGARALFAAVHGIVSLALDSKLGPREPHELDAQVRFMVAAGANALPRLA